MKFPIVSILSNKFKIPVHLENDANAGALGEENDLLWVFSTSGSSTNIIKAVQAAKSKDMISMAFTGKPSSQLGKISDICLCSQTENTAHAQEIHQIAYHIICVYIELSFSEEQ